MKKIETSIIINSTPTHVWNIITDFENYAQWNPFIQSITGKKEKGGTLTVKIAPEGMKPQTFKPEILEFKTDQELKWAGKLFIKGLFDGEHYFQLNRLNDNQVQLVHGERFRGLLVNPIFKKIGAATLSGFEAMNRAVKDRAELQKQSLI